MSEISMPWKSLNGDRALGSADFASYYANFLSNGVFQNIANSLQVKASESPNMQITVKKGNANINGYAYMLREEKKLTLKTANNQSDRIDTVVLRWSLMQRAIEIAVKENTKELERNESIYELKLAEITIRKSSAYVYQGDIEDVRGDSSVCGFVSVNNEIDTTDLLEQFNAELKEYTANLKDFSENAESDFLEWFENLKNILDENVAAKLQKQLDVLNTDRDETKATEHLFVIEHELKGYPLINVLYAEYGLGTVPVATEPSGTFGGTKPYTISCDIEYDGHSKLSVLVPKKYMMKKYDVVRISATEYLLVEGVRSIKIIIFY